MMKIIIRIEPAMDDGGNEMVQFIFVREAESSSMAVLRATARMMRAISEEYEKLASESEFIKKELKGEEA